MVLQAAGMFQALQIADFAVLYVLAFFVIETMLP